MNSPSDADLIGALRASHYPGARDESVWMVINYCRAMRVDPMLKPVHIVPMKVSNPATRQDEWRDVVMPGIGLYRIIADRSGAYLGKAAPVLGPIVTLDIMGDKFDVPEWIEVTVRKAVGQHVAEFTAREWWIENYGQKSGGYVNQMWRTRRIGQLAKCAETQALRQAFPDLMPSGPTIDERSTSPDAIEHTDIARESLPGPDSQAERIAEQLRGRKSAVVETAVDGRQVTASSANTTAVSAYDELALSVVKIADVESANDLLDVLRHAEITAEQSAYLRRGIQAKVREIMNETQGNEKHE